MGGFGPSFAPPIQQTAESSNVAGALSFDTFIFFATNAGASVLAQTEWSLHCRGCNNNCRKCSKDCLLLWVGLAHIVQYFLPLLEGVYAPHSQSVAAMARATATVTATVMVTAMTTVTATATVMGMVTVTVMATTTVMATVMAMLTATATATSMAIGLAMVTGATTETGKATATEVATATVTMMKR